MQLVFTLSLNRVRYCSIFQLDALHQVLNSIQIRVPVYGNKVSTKWDLFASTNKVNRFSLFHDTVPRHLIVLTEITPRPLLSNVIGTQQ